MRAIVTGCANGIGKAILLALIQQGYYVHGIDKSSKDLAALEAAVLEPHQFLIADLAKQDQVDFCIEQIKQEQGKLDLIINNACFSNQGILSGCDWDAFNEVLYTGITAPYYLVMKLQEELAYGASIINISSTRAQQSQKDTESYSAAKGGIEALTRALAMSLQGKCRVNCIAPGWIDTFDYEVKEADLLQHPSGRIGTVQDIVRAVNYLKDPDNVFVNAQVITVDGGMSRRMIYHNDEGWTYHE